MQTETEIIAKRAPICGIASILAPLAAVAAGCAGLQLFRFFYPNDDGWLSGLGFVFLPAYGCILGGIILAGIAARRDEKWWLLPWIGVLLNASPFIFAFVRG